MDEQFIKEFEEKCIKGLTKSLGFKVTDVREDGYCELVAPLNENAMNPMNTVHGGFIFTLGDTVGGLALRAIGDMDGCTTTTSTIDYMNPVINSKKLIGKAQIVKHGKRMSTADIKIYDENDIVIAQMLGRYYHLYGKDFKAR